MVNTSNCDSFLTSEKFTVSNVRRYALVYHLFGLLWTYAFIEVCDALACWRGRGGILRMYRSSSSDWDAVGL